MARRGFAPERISIITVYGIMVKDRAAKLPKDQRQE